jgi:hypothetical protein
MTPQSTFMVIAPIDPSRRDELKTLLRSMISAPGIANPASDLVPLGRLDTLHVARWLILDDSTSGDAAAYGVAPESLPLSLVFMGDCDGAASDLLHELAGVAGPGLRRIFSCCRDFDAQTDLCRWMQAHEQRPATNYINWIGRTVKQVREESALRDSIVQYLAANASTLAEAEPREIRSAILDFVRREQAAGRLQLTPAEATPLDWKLRNAIHLIAVPLILLLLSPAILLYLPIFAFQLRTREKRDPEIAPRPDPAHVALLARLEDHDVSNQFSAYGTVKPGLFRRWTLSFFLAVVNYSTRHIYGRGHLARVSTIHFARWIFLNGSRNLLFASNYDGSLESYMDDFINKVAWGLNLVFSNGMGYPQTNWLVRDGAKDEQKFKYYIRRHQLPTDVWYKAYPGLSTIDLRRNTLIRQGLEQSNMTDSEIQSWLNLL